jgi:hypothetical protein
MRKLHTLARACCCNNLNARKYDDPYARGRASNILSVHPRPRYAKFNTKKTTTTTTQQTENVMKNETKPLPISSSFKKDLPHLKNVSYKNIPPKNFTMMKK